MNDELVNPNTIQEPNNITSISNTFPPQPTPSKTSRFAEIFSGILGGAVNLVLPGILPIGGFFRNRGLSSLIGRTAAASTITDSLPDVEALLGQSAQQGLQLLNVQNIMQNQNLQFTMFTNMLKARHDGSMSAVQNFKS